MTRKMTKEEFHALKMNRFVTENVSLVYNEQTGLCEASVYFQDEKLETALRKGYGFQGE